MSLNWNFEKDFIWFYKNHKRVMGRTNYVPQRWIYEKSKRLLQKGWLQKMKKELNNNIKYFVVHQERDIEKWGQALLFFKMYYDEHDKKVKWNSENYPENATQFSTYEEAEHYAFAFNFNASRNSYDTSRYFPIAIDMTYLPKLIKHENESTNTDSVSDPSDDGNGETAWKENANMKFTKAELKNIIMDTEAKYEGIKPWEYNCIPTGYLEEANNFYYAYVIVTETGDLKKVVADLSGYIITCEHFPF